MGSDVTSKGMVERLSSYRNVLHKLKNLGFVRVFSDNLADALGISASQVRKDFSQFELKGNKRAGYQVDELIDRLSEILGKNEVQRIIIVGCGKIGMALMNYNRFSNEGIRVVAGFDTDPTVIAPNARIPIFDIAEVAKFVKDRQVQVAIMTVPESAAPQVYEQLVAAGIEGVLNFTPAQLRGTDRCITQNVNIEREIENLFYFVNLRGRTQQ